MRSLKVVSCPDKLKLGFCLLEGDSKSQLPVRFCVQEVDRPNHEWFEDAKIDSVERSDGSGNNFTLVGYNVANKASVKVFISFASREGSMRFY